MSSGTAGRILLCLLAAGVSTSSSAQTQESLPNPPQAVGPSDVLSVVPAEAGMVLVFRDLAGMDARLAGLLESLGVDVSPLALVQRSLGIVSGFDVHGSAALAVMPTDTGVPMSAGLVLILPTTNRKEILAFLAPEPAGDDLVRAVVRGKDTYVAHRCGFTFFAPTPSMARRAASAPRSIDTQLSEDQRRQIAGEDISVYVDIEAFPRTGLGRRFTGWLREQRGIRASLDPLKRVLISAHADASGISFLAAFRHDAAMAQERVVDSSTHLRGHLQEPFGLVMDVAVSESGRRERVAIDALLSMAVRAGVVRSDRVESLRTAMGGALSQTARASSSVALLSAGGGSQFGLSIVLTTRNGATLLVRAMEDLVRTIKSGVFMDEQYSRLFQRLSWQRAVESAGDVTVDQLRLPLNDLPGVDQGKAASLFTPDGLVVRIGTVDNQQVVITMGGGSDRFKEIVTNLRASQTPLASDAGIQLSRMRMPSDRRGEGFVALDRLVPIWCRLTSVLGKECEMLQIPAIGVPFAFYSLEASPTSSVYGGFVPVELLMGLRKASSQLGAEAAALPSPSSDATGQ